MYIEIYGRKVESIDENKVIHLGNIITPSYKDTVRTFDLSNGKVTGKIENIVGTPIIYIARHEDGTYINSGLIRDYEKEDSASVSFNCEDFKKMLDTEIRLDFSQDRYYDFSLKGMIDMVFTKVFEKNDPLVNIFPIKWFIPNKAELINSKEIADYTGQCIIINGLSFLKPYLSYYNFFVKPSFLSSEHSITFTIIESETLNENVDYGLALHLNDFIHERTSTNMTINKVTATIKYETVNEVNPHWARSNEEYFNSQPFSNTGEVKKEFSDEVNPQFVSVDWKAVGNGHLSCNGRKSIDGGNPKNGEKVLFVNAGVQNGIYMVNYNGNWTRVEIPMEYLQIKNGQVNKNSLWDYSEGVVGFERIKRTDFKLSTSEGYAKGFALRMYETKSFQYYSGAQEDYNFPISKDSVIDDITGYLTPNIDMFIAAFGEINEAETDKVYKVYWLDTPNQYAKLKCIMINKDYYDLSDLNIIPRPSLPEKTYTLGLDNNIYEGLAPENLRIYPVSEKIFESEYLSQAQINAVYELTNNRYIENITIKNTEIDTILDLAIYELYTKILVNDMNGNSKVLPISEKTFIFTANENYVLIKLGFKKIELTEILKSISNEGKGIIISSSSNSKDIGITEEQKEKINHSVQQINETTEVEAWNRGVSSMTTITNPNACLITVSSQNGGSIAQLKIVDGQLIYIRKGYKAQSIPAWKDITPNMTYTITPVGGGSDRWFKICSIPWFSNDGNVHGWVKIKVYGANRYGSPYTELNIVANSRMTDGNACYAWINSMSFEADAFGLYTKNENGRAEIWLKVGSYNTLSKIVIEAGVNQTAHFQLQSTQPSGLTIRSIHNRW